MKNIALYLHKHEYIHEGSKNKKHRGYRMRAQIHPLLIILTVVSIIASRHRHGITDHMGLILITKKGSLAAWSSGKAFTC